jgi:ABC-type multidrug transport system permease subunit
MLRTVALIFRNEFRLLRRDHAALFMLFLAPIVIIAVAGFSLGSLYGVASRRVYIVPVVDRDHGAVASAILRSLSSGGAIRVSAAQDLDAALAFVTRHDDAPLALVIPAGTTAAFESGKPAHVRVYVDPIKRIEASAIELQLNRLSRRIGATARERAQEKISRQAAELRARLARIAALSRALQSELAEFERELKRSRTRLQSTLKARIQSRLESLRETTLAAIERSTSAQKTRLEGELSRKQAAVTALTAYLRQLQASKRQFEHWLSDLKAAAGSHASEIPPPPRWPAPPSAEMLAELSRPVDVSIGKPAIPAFGAAFDTLEIPRVGLPAIPRLSLKAGDLASVETPVLPGQIGWRERSLTKRSAEANSFDQYVPGFGVTFLLLDVVWGISVGLIDERDWGTLERLRISGAPVPAMLVGKLSSRFLVGFIQMVVLFSVGWLLFGVSLGGNPWALLLPTAAISFAAASFGLVIACTTQTRDSVLPIGAVAAMSLSAIGGCWWPLGFEPAWMRAVADWLPTTWTMQAYNDLMIRGLAPSSAVLPAAITFGLGLLFLLLGILGSPRIYR